MGLTKTKKTHKTHKTRPAKYNSASLKQTIDHSGAPMCTRASPENGCWVGPAETLHRFWPKAGIKIQKQQFKSGKLALCVVGRQTSEPLP
jgi:hypothetical protein